MSERKAVTRELAKQYRRASKAEKTEMLDQLCEGGFEWSSQHGVVSLGYN